MRSADPAIVNQIETQFRQPALYFAALVQGDDESSELIKLLIRNGANVKHKDFNEQTILFYICREGTSSVTKERKSAHSCCSATDLVWTTSTSTARPPCFTQSVRTGSKLSKNTQRKVLR